MAYQQDVYFANDTTVGGTGTFSDPFRGPATNTTWFDAVLTKPNTDPLYIGPNRTLRLGPGTFQTAGIDFNGTGWAPKSGWRLLGSGINATTLRLTNPNAGDRCAIGLPSSPVTALSGFEASDFTLDCGYSTSGGITGTPGTANRAIFVYGTHIYLRRLRVQNFGGTSAAQMILIQPASIQSEDSILEECAIDATLSSIGSAICVLTGLGGNSASQHRYCVVRNCTFRGPTSGTAHGLMPGCAFGFVAEGNEFVDLSSGIYDPPYPPGTETASDIIVRHNYFRNVSNGIGYSARAWPLSRMIVHDNIMDIANSGTGIQLLGSTNPTIYTNLVIRKNIIRNVNWDTTPGTITGINISRVQDLVVQYNIINNYGTNQGIIRNNYTNQTISDNVSSNGGLVPVFP